MNSAVAESEAMVRTWFQKVQSVRYRAQTGAAAVLAGSVTAS